MDDDNDNSNHGNSGDNERTITIVIILIAAIVIFFLIIAWCGFFYGLWRNKKVALDISRIDRLRQQQQYRQQQLLEHHQQQQHNAPQQLLQQQQRYTPQLQQQMQQQLRQQQLRQQQLRQQHNANRSRPSSQLSPNVSHASFTHQPQLNSYPPTPQMPYHDRVSVHSGYIAPAAVAIPVFIPPRDYDDDLDQTPLYPAANSPSVSSSGLGHSYHNRTFDYFEGSSSPNQSFANIGYQSTISYPDDATAGINQSKLRSGYSPAPPRSTSTPVVHQMQARHKRTSQPASFENYSIEMQQYQQLQRWPQNY